ncbi:MAG: anthranilate synthase component I [Spirochaetaceae bacterium]|nr:MAG: anthranilate synthase component I [Spirochaetaceae bacterium]
MAQRSDGIIKILPGERYTPYALAKKLQAAAILESSSYQKGRERYSILMVDEAFRIEQRGDQVLMQADGKRYRIRSAGRDILDVLRYFAEQHTPPHQDFPFPSGGIGYLSYEFAAHCDSIRFSVKPDPLQLPDAAFIFGHVFLIFDHYTDLLYVIGLNYNEHEVDLQRAVAEVERRITDLNFNYLQDENADYPAAIIDQHVDREPFLSGVQSVKQQIIAGNLLQGVLSRRLRIRTAMPALEAYRRLRTANPSPYLFYVDFSGYQIFGSSPEVHVKVKDNEVRMRPIAGTRRRGADRGDDQRLEAELLADPKERAEHLMLVDLARNDLGRVCEAGSVVVHRYMSVERFSHVMHIVSEVRGQLAAGRSGADAVRATFPAGTVSGAPKIRAIEVIDALEREPRRFYAGLVGYMEPGGNLDTCITIRSALKQADSLVLQAGAGVVYDSTPEREYEETGEKLRALAHAVGVEV